MIEISANPLLLRKTESAGVPASGSTKFSRILQAAAPPAQELDAIFSKAAERYQVPEELIRAVAFHESRYQPEVVSSAGAMGVMQLMPGTAKEMGVKDPFDPEQNVMGGAKLLGQLFDKYDGDLKLTLAAYGAGSGSVAKYNGVPPFEETQNFVRDIMSVVGEQVERPQKPSPTYSNMVEGITSYSDFTESDYRLFIAYLLQQQEEWMAEDSQTASMWRF